MSEDSVRIDKWLWFARFVKSRSLAQKLCESGRVDLNGRKVTRSHQMVRPGDVLTLRLEPWRRTVTVRAPGERRGPAPEAQTLYDEPEPPIRTATDDDGLGLRPRGAGRPTKRDRRAIDRLDDNGNDR